MGERNTAPMMQSAVTPRRIDGEEFRAILLDLADGKRVTQQEMADACVYADRLPEIRDMMKALLAAWNVCMTRINYKNQRIARLERQLKACRLKLEKEAGHENA